MWGICRWIQEGEEWEMIGGIQQTVNTGGGEKWRFEKMRCCRGRFVSNTLCVFIHFTWWFDLLKDKKLLIVSILRYTQNWINPHHFLPHLPGSSSSPSFLSIYTSTLMLLSLIIMSTGFPLLHTISNALYIQLFSQNAYTLKFSMKVVWLKLNGVVTSGKW